MFLWNIAVTSLAEVWIEIGGLQNRPDRRTVTSLAEVWIEIWLEMVIVGVEMASLPLRKCGLKFVDENTICQYTGHFPCGSVD